MEASMNVEEHTTAWLNFHNALECEHIGTATAKDERRGRQGLKSRYHDVVIARFSGGGKVKFWRNAH